MPREFKGLHQYGSYSNIGRHRCDMTPLRRMRTKEARVELFIKKYISDLKIRNYKDILGR